MVSTTKSNPKRQAVEIQTPICLGIEIDILSSEKEKGFEAHFLIIHFCVNGGRRMKQTDSYCASFTCELIQCWNAHKADEAKNLHGNVFCVHTFGEKQSKLRGEDPKGYEKADEGVER